MTRQELIIELYKEFCKDLNSGDVISEVLFDNDYLECYEFCHPMEEVFEHGFWQDDSADKVKAIQSAFDGDYKGSIKTPFDFSRKYWLFDYESDKVISTDKPTPFYLGSNFALPILELYVDMYENFLKGNENWEVLKGITPKAMELLNNFFNC